jgi:hypothetical protein
MHSRNQLTSLLRNRQLGRGRSPLPSPTAPRTIQQHFHVRASPTLARLYRVDLHNRLRNSRRLGPVPRDLADKGKKGADANVLPNGEKIVHLKVGGRTSAIVPSVQKKTAAVAGDVDGDEDEDEGAESKPAKGRKRKVKSEDEDEDEEKPAPKKAVAKGKGKASSKATKVKKQDSDDDADVGAEDSNEIKEEEKEAKPKKTAAAKKEKVEKPTPAAGTRRSARTKAT